MRRLLTLLLAVTVLGCVATAEDVVTLKMWTFLNPDGTSPRDLVLRAIVDEFNATHPGIHVEVQSIHWREIDNKAIQATAAGLGPDILNVYSVQLPKHIAAGTLIPIETYVNQWWPQNGDDYTISPSYSRG